MTTLYKQSLRCSVCGTETEQTGIGSTNTFGSPDLDTRPPEMKRSTIHAWVQCCSGCGACADDLSKVDESARDVVKRPDYAAQLRNSEFPELANFFICKSMIDEYGGKFASATWALIHAAWACDDAKSTAQAVSCRRRAAAMLRKAEANGQEVTQQPGASTAILVDLLRRAAALDEAAGVVDQAGESFSEEIFAQMLNYQKELIEAGDLDCHTIAEALGDSGHAYPNAFNAAKRHPVSRKRWWQFWR